MLDLLAPIKGLAKIDRLNIDNGVFRLHYKLTLKLLLILGTLTSLKQYIGDPIDCIVDHINPNVMDTYCWIYSTFTIPNKLTARIGKDVAHPGVGAHIQEEDQIKYHKYYQWVCFALLFQAILFYIPRYLWKTWESNRTKMLTLDLNQPIVNQQCKEERKKLLADYFKNNAGSHDCYFLKFCLCEVMNFINVLGQIFFMDFFLDGEFWSYGDRVFQYNHNYMDGDEDPMARVFPKVTKCTFHKYGPSGSVQRFDGLCVLPVNILNEKIYAILWFWFIILLILSSLVVFYRIFYICSSCTRLMVLAQGIGNKGKASLRRAASHLRLGDWFVLSQLKSNMDSKIFEEVVDELANVLDQKQYSSY